ncbi:MAG: sugar phosphate isomerase/epimerase [Blautia sp.]|nr:sugar phosphate isomerase/epimerase [Blautia sp.]
MKLGLFTTLFPDMELIDLLALTRELGIEALELSSKPDRGLRHFHPRELLENESALICFQDTLKRNNMIISQLNCSCNPVSPIPGEEQKSREDFEIAFRLAEKLNIRTVCSFSGCPGGGPGEKTPNWITCAWPPQYQNMLKWQWEEKLIPFWTWASKRGADFGVNQLAIEMHPGFCVYNPDTLLRLRQAVGSVIGANLDPSHLIWQGISIPDAICALKGAIWHVHAKDTFINQRNVRINGVLDTRHYSRAEERSWTFRTVGYGMSRDTWKEIISFLILSGYDGVISIEHEDMFLSKPDGLSKAATFLKEILPIGNPDGIWWA